VVGCPNSIVFDTSDLCRGAGCFLCYGKRHATNPDVQRDSGSRDGGGEFLFRQLERQPGQGCDNRRAGRVAGDEYSDDRGRQSGGEPGFAAAGRHYSCTRTRKSAAIWTVKRTARMKESTNAALSRLRAMILSLRNDLIVIQARLAVCEKTLAALEKRNGSR